MAKRVIVRTALKNPELYEKDIQRAVEENLGLLEEGLEFIDSFVPTAVGVMDTLALDSGKRLVIIDYVTAVKEQSDALIRTLDYCTWSRDPRNLAYLQQFIAKRRPELAETDSVDENTRVILVAQDFEERVLRAAVSVAPDVTLISYRIFEWSEEELGLVIETVLQTHKAQVLTQPAEMADRIPAAVVEAPEYHELTVEGPKVGAEEPEGRELEPPGEEFFVADEAEAEPHALDGQGEASAGLAEELVFGEAREAEEPETVEAAPVYHELTIEPPAAEPPSEAQLEEEYLAAQLAGGEQEPATPEIQPGFEPAIQPDVGSFPEVEEGAAFAWETAIQGRTEAEPFGAAADFSAPEDEDVYPSSFEVPDKAAPELEAPPAEEWGAPAEEVVPPAPSEEKPAAPVFEGEPAAFEPAEEFAPQAPEAEAVFEPEEAPVEFQAPAEAVPAQPFEAAVEAAPVSEPAPEPTRTQAPPAAGLQEQMRDEFREDFAAYRNYLERRLDQQMDELEAAVERRLSMPVDQLVQEAKSRMPLGRTYATVAVISAVVAAIVASLAS